jgi:hypothetical protein
MLLAFGITAVLVFSQSRSSFEGAVLKQKCMHVPNVVLEEQQYQQWLSSFQAADPAFQDYCLRVLQNSERQDKGAEYNQDIFLFHNFFKFWPANGKKGFYVESGANDALSISSSLFFDQCLGWPGLCIEPQPTYHR